MKILNNIQDKRNLKVVFNLHIRNGDTCSIKIEASKDDINQTNSPRIDSKPSTNDLKEREKQRQTVRRFLKV